jgi:oxygen-independent coproporphyrinogen-3 oxidase
MCSLVSKYNVAGPRYTSYPTVPYWDQGFFNRDTWIASLKNSFKESNATQGISLYIHLPFCESMCTFCGCNKRITKNHAVELPYIETVIEELKLYVKLFNQRPRVKQIHLGGGTPTFFAPDHLKYLITSLFKWVDQTDEVEFSFEGHPNNTTNKHLEVLREMGFTRVCYGVQDYNLTVQKAINRVQPFENVSIATKNARALGYESVGHDIIYGLPFQTEEHVMHTINKTIELQPDRIAFYSYAHVPWIKGNGQRGYKDSDLPTAFAKRRQYELGKNMLLDAGYIEIGMDHFTLPTDALYKAQQDGTIHRNFMGYSSSKTQVMIGLGVSSISDSWYSFAQNVKDIEAYKNLVNQGELPVYRGHILTDEDIIIRTHILNLMCNFETSWKDESLYFDELPEILASLVELQKDGLIELQINSLKVTSKGRAFVRNVCLPFDLRLKRKQPETQLFSMTV